MKRALFIFLTVLLTSGNVFAKNESELDAVIINLGFTPQYEFAGFYAAKELGFYRELGLEVTFFTPPDSSFYTFPKNGEFDYFVTSPSRILGLENRDDYIIVSPIFQQSPISLVVREEDNIITLKQLEGKKIGSGVENQAMLKIAGVNLDSVFLARPTTNSSLLLDSTLDGVSSYIIDIYKPKERLKVFRPIHFGINFYGDCLAATQKEFRENPERLRKIREATIKGWKFAIDSPEDVAKIIHNEYNSKISVDDLIKESAIVINTLILPNLYQVGYNDCIKWENMNKILMDLKIVSKPLNLKKFIYTPPTESVNQLKYFLTISLSVLGVIAVLLLGVLVYNFQLKKAISIQTKELRDTNRELENLNNFRIKILAIITHDTRGPLHNITAIIGFFNQKIIGLEELKNLFRELELNLSQVNLLLNNILEWSKSNFDKTEEKVIPTQVDLKALIKRTVELFSFNIHKKNIQVELNISNDYLLADENMVSSILRNLIC